MQLRCLDSRGIPAVSSGGGSPEVELVMAQEQGKFEVTVTATAKSPPIVVVYGTLREAMRAANGLRGVLSPKGGGQVVVRDAEGNLLQGWAEGPLGGDFARPGDFFHAE